MKRRNQSRICKNKNHFGPKTPGEPKTRLSSIRSHRLLQKVNLSLFRYDLSLGRAIKIIPRVLIDWGMRCFLWHIEEKISRSTHSQIPKLVIQISHPHRCIKHNNRCNNYISITINMDSHVPPMSSRASTVPRTDYFPHVAFQVILNGWNSTRDGGTQSVLRELIPKSKNPNI